MLFQGIQRHCQSCFDHRQCGGESRAINMAAEYMENETSFCIVFTALPPLDEKGGEHSSEDLYYMRFDEILENFKADVTVHYANPSLVCIGRTKLANGDFVFSTLVPDILEHATATAAMERPIEKILKSIQKCFVSWLFVAGL